jgi:hypothetical protein
LAAVKRSSPKRTCRPPSPGKKNADVGLDYGDLVLLAEAVTTQVSLAARESADVPRLKWVTCAGREQQLMALAANAEPLGRCQS